MRDDRGNTLTPSDTRDGRVTVGDVRISRPGLAPSTLPGAIPVPANTLSEDPATAHGESLQQRNERIDAQNRILAAEATIAEEHASATRRRLDRLDGLNAPAPIFHGSYAYPIFRSGGYGFIGGRRVNIPGSSNADGNFTTTDGYDDDIHGRAQRNYSDAAAAASRRQPDLHRQAIIESNRAATPPLIDQQNRRDQIQIEQSKSATPKRD